MTAVEPGGGAGPAWRAFVGDLERVAPSDVTVLIEGEHGSGKSRAARTLHARSARESGPFVEIDLGALAPTLIEAELFGHEEGAFTGADRARVGRFRRADGGTLVLDGIEGLSADLQGKLLRALQERKIEPLGGEAPVDVDVRVVATCARDLRAEVEAGRFREDLYYRVAVVTLRVPPLRARADELPDLAAEIAVEVATRAGVPPRPLTAQAVDRLATHPWPGNVRELENAIERILVLAPGAGEPVAASELDFLEEAVVGAARGLAREALAHGLSLDRLTLAMMEEALAEERGNLSAAARRLGLSRRALEYRRNKLQEDAPVDAQLDDDGPLEGKTPA